MAKDKSIEQIEPLVAQKSEHIAYLEELMRRIARGRGMRLLRSFGR